MRDLVTAPYVGEIGWELMSWQARVRWYFERGAFEKLVVIGASGKSAFYDDMPLDYHEVDLSVLPGDACEDRRVVQDSSGAAIRAPSASEGLTCSYQEPVACAPGSEKAGPASAPVSPETIRAAVLPMVEPIVARLRNQGHEVEVLWPEYAGTLYPCEPEYQEFIRFERSLSEPVESPWVVLVQRTREFGSKNWSSSKWAELASRLKERGIHTSVFPCHSEAAIETLSACDLAVGQSTGGLHLAALCGCPRLVWSLEHYLWSPWDATNRQRYETLWNPLGTPVEVHEVNQLPSPTEAADQIIGALETIGRHTGSRKSRLAFQLKWTLRNWLVRNVIQTRACWRWPWPVQRLVRYQVV